MRITVVKQFVFDSAHFLTDYVGKCANMHGHTYKLEVGVSGEVNDKGFIMDFGHLKQMVQPYIDMMDHNMLNEISTQVKWGSKSMNFPTKSTAENMVMYLYHELVYQFRENNKAPNGGIDTDMQISFIRLWETPTSYAEWRAE